MAHSRTHSWLSPLLADIKSLLLPNEQKPRAGRRTESHRIIACTSLTLTGTLLLF